MKITANNLIKNYADLRLQSKDSFSSFAVSDSKPNFDALTIESNPRQIEELRFAHALSRELSKEVSAPVPDEQLTSLSQRISAHTYQVDAHAIASKILLIHEEA